MAKNRSMAIKHAKAKKCAMQEVMDNAKAEMCCKTIPKNIHIYCNSSDEFFYSRYAIQRRIDALTGTHYKIEDFREKWNDIYLYLTTHTVPETRQHFSIKKFID